MLRSLPPVALVGALSMAAVATAAAQTLTRTIEFATTEGTWVSLDVSPDGRTIVFDLLGDLYTLPIEGGKATRITNGRALDAMPRFSVDGQWIVFSSDRTGGADLWVIRPDGRDLRQIASQIEGAFISPSFTADGKSIITGWSPIRTPSEALKQFPVAGGEGVLLRRDSIQPVAAPSTPRGPLTSRDGRYLYFAGTGATGFTRAPIHQIYRRDLTTGRDEIITDSKGSAMRPVVSPDGSTLAYATRFDGRSGIRLRNLATARERWLIHPLDWDNLDAYSPSRDFLPGYAFTPDGKELVIAIDRHIRRVDLATGQAREIPMTVDVSLELGPKLRFAHRVDTGVLTTRYVSEPALSPDGQKIVFGAFGRLYQMTLPNGRPSLLVGDDVHGMNPVWSADGRWIAYRTFDPTTGGAIWKVPAEGGQPVKLLADDHSYRDLVWSPDGSRLMVTRTGYDFERRQGRSQGQALVTIPASGPAVLAVVTDSGYWSGAHFSGTGDRIYFQGDGLQSMTAQGRDRRKLLDVVNLPGRNAGAGASEYQVSPDGAHALFKMRQELYLVRLPAAGDTAAMVLHIDAPGTPTKLLSSTGVDFFGWTEGGRTIYWTIGSTLFRLPLGSVEFPPLPAQPFRGPVRDMDAVHAIRRQPDPSRPVQPTAVELVVERPRYRPVGTIALRGGRIIPIDGAPIERGDVVVSGDRILAVGRSGTIPIPRDAKVVDVTGKTLVPGFIDLHPHWTALDLERVEWRPWSLEAALAYGVTTGRLPGGGGEKQGQFTYADLQAAGEITAPRIYAAEPNVGSEVQVNTQAEADSLVSKFRRYYRTDFLKMYLTGPRRTRQLIANASAKYEILATSESGRDVALQLTNILDGYAVEHLTQAAPIGDDFVQLWARSESVYDPTLVISQSSPHTPTALYRYLYTLPFHDDAKARRFLTHAALDDRIENLTWYDDFADPTPLFAAQVARVARGGGTVVIGSHSEAEGLSYQWEMWALARGGMTPTEILTAATINGAKAMGFERDLGSLTTGKLADVVVLSANPLSDIRNTGKIAYVMRGGTLYDGETLDEIWPKPSKRPAGWWRAMEPARSH